MEKVYKSSEVLKEVRRLKKAYPDAIYNRPKNVNACFYSKGIVKNGPKTCGCLIGQAIRNIYPDLFTKLKNNEIRNGASSAADDIDLIGNSVDRLAMIQLAQDMGECWKDCKET